MIPDKIELEIVTPERKVLSETVDSVVIPGTQGYLGVLPGHTPLLTGLMIGELSYIQGGKEHVLAVSQGYAEVLRGKVSVLAERCEKAEEIDVERAENAKKRAEEVLKRKDVPMDEFRRAELSIQRAITRMQARKHGLG
jgi:F-type H+-transporting ATPase subunit epsilon